MRVFPMGWALCLVLVLASVATAQSTATLSLSQGAKPSAVEAQARPFVLLTAAHLLELRNQVKPGGYKHDLYVASVKQNAERWINRTITIPERAGHFHHFTCIDGTRLEVPADQQFDSPSTGSLKYKCSACGATYSGRKYEGGQRHAEHTWLIAACLDLALAGALEERSDYQQKAAEILRKYADAYPGRHTSPTSGGIYYQSLDESVHFISLAQAYDLIYDCGVLNPTDKQHIENDLFWEAAEGLIKCGIGGNWGSWHLSAVGVIGYATKHQRYIDYGLKSFRSQMTNQLGDDGLWPESVHTYHFYPMRAFLHLAEAATNAGEDLYKWEVPRDPHYHAFILNSWDSIAGKSLEAMFTAPLRYMYPNFQLPAINDGWFFSYLPLDIYQVGFRRYDNAEIGWAVQQLKSVGLAAQTKSPDAVPLWSLLHDEPIDYTVAPPDLPPTNFPVIGLAVLRQPATATTSQTVLTFDYGRHLGHGQADKMGITLFANGKLLVADYGTPSYGANILPYYKGTTSHNTIRVNGVDQRATTDSRLLTVAELGSGSGPLSSIQLASAETDQVAPGVRWRRTVALAPDYALILDDLTSSASATFDSFIHCEGGIHTGAAQISAVSTETLKLQYFESAREIRTHNGDPSFVWVKPSPWERNLVMVHASKPSQLKHYVAFGPAETGSRFVPAVMSRAEGKSLFLATLLYFGSGVDEVIQPTVEITGLQVKVVTPSHEDTYEVTAGTVRLSGR